MSNSEGLLIRVKVHAGVRKESFLQKSETSFEISVKESAGENRANTRARELLARHFRTDIKKIRIISGHHSPNKSLRVHFA